MTRTFSARVRYGEIAVVDVEHPPGVGSDENVGDDIEIAEEQHHGHVQLLKDVNSERVIRAARVRITKRCSALGVEPSNGMVEQLHAAVTYGFSILKLRLARHDAGHVP